MRREVLEIADALRAIAQTGLHFTEGEYDRERYEKIQGLAVRLGGLAADGDVQALKLAYERDDGYITPKLDVRMAVFRSDRVLLVRERVDGCWSLPGGYVDVGDTPGDAAERETLEEAGLVVRRTRLVGIFDRRLDPGAPPHPFHIIKLVFLGEARDPHAEPGPGPETTDARFCALDALPELSLGRTRELHLREAARVRDDPGALPYLD